MSTLLRAGAISAWVLVPMSIVAQGPPDFSGEWVLASATTSGSGGRGEAGTSKTTGERPTSSNVASGAAFNCGRQCSIAHKGQTLTIDKALLAADTTAAAAVTLHLDGRQVPVVDSFNPGRKIPATATWKGGKLEITSTVFTQLVSIEGAQLVVVTKDNHERSSPVTWRYKRR